MRVRALASGSQGNAVAFTCGEGLFLVDCGLSCRELERRLRLCALDPAAVRGIFFTHDHLDHCRGLAIFRKRHPETRFYANGNTADAIATISGVEDGWCVFETSETFAEGALEVTTFSVPHDAADPVGYLFCEGEARFFLGTDMGLATAPVKEALARATCAVLEANHDPMLLQMSDRPVSLKQRIAGRDGHLSNTDTARLIEETRPQGLRHLLLAHLSRQCNAPYLARAAVESALKTCGLSPTLTVLAQDAPSEVFEF